MFSWVEELICQHRMENIMELQKIKYTDLNAKAQEIYNFHKAASILSDYVLICIEI